MPSILPSMTFLFAIDSFLAAAGLAMLGGARLSPRRIVVAFVVSDMVATLAGALLSAAAGSLTPTLSSAAGPAVTLAAAAALLMLVRARTFPAASLLVPAVLGVDNLVLGAIDPSGSPLTTAGAAGLASGLAAWAGFAVGRPLSRMLPWRGAWAVGVATIAFVLVH